VCEGNPTAGHPNREINFVLRDSQTAGCADVAGCADTLVKFCVYFDGPS